MESNSRLHQHEIQYHYEIELEFLNPRILNFSLPANQEKA